MDSQPSHPSMSYRARLKRELGHDRFINIAHPDEIRGSSLQGAVRRHATRTGALTRRKRPRTRIIALEIKQADKAAIHDERPEKASITEIQGSVVAQTRWRRPRLTVHPEPSQSSLLGIDLTSQDLRLLQFMRAEADYKYRAFHAIWVRITFSDPTALYLSLASSATFHEQMMGGEAGHKSPLCTAGRYYTKAVRSLNARLNDPEDCVSCGVIATVLGCLCHDTNLEDWERWGVHISGLSEILRLRGGVGGLDEELTLMIIWLDLVGCTYLDTKPRFYLHGSALVTGSGIEDSSPALRHLCRQMIIANPVTASLTHALHKMAHIAKVVNRYGCDPGFWQNERSAISLLAPAIHYLQSGRVYIDGSRMCALARLSCLMLLSALKRLFSLNSADMEPLQTRFARLIPTSNGDWSKQEIVLILWSLMTAALLCSSVPERQRRFMTVAREFGILGGYHDAAHALQTCKGLIWINIIEDPGASLISENGVEA